MISFVCQFVVTQSFMPTNAILRRNDYFIGCVIIMFLVLACVSAPAGATYNYPLVAAVKLMNNICRSGRHLAAQLVS